MSHTATRERDALSPACRHHWVIETPNGSLSLGFCKLCGVERSFRNSSEDMMWDSDSFSLNGSRYRGRRERNESLS